jgi:hypothetical protein
MSKTQIWDLLEIYQLLQCATDTKKQLEAFELLTEFIEENCFKEGL